MALICYWLFVIEMTKTSFKTFENQYSQGRELIANALKLLNGYINYLKRQKSQITNNN